MQVGDLIRFRATDCHGLVTKVERVGVTVFVHVLCGPDADGEHAGETRAFPRQHIENPFIAEVINESR